MPVVINPCKNPRSFGELYRHWKHLVKIKMRPGTKGNFIYFATDYGYTEAEAESFYDYHMEKMSRGKEDEIDDNISFMTGNPIKVKAIKKEFLVGALSKLGRYVKIEIVRPTQDVEYLGLYGKVTKVFKRLSPPATRYIGDITRVVKDRYMVLLENGKEDYFEDWQIQMLELTPDIYAKAKKIREAKLSIEIDETKEKLKEKQELLDYIKKRKSMKILPVVRREGKTLHPLDPKIDITGAPERTTYGMWYELFTDLKKEEPLKRQRQKYDNWLKDVRKLIPRANRGLGDDALLRLLKSLGYDAKVE